MKKQLTMIASLLVLSACGQSGGNADNIFSVPRVNEGKTIVTVNGTEIKEGFLNTLSELSPRLKSQIDNPLTRKKIVDSLVEQQLLYQEAVKRGLHNDENVRLKTLLNKHTIVSNSLLEDELNKAMQAEYEKRKDAQFTRVGISQIAINYLPEAEAKKGAKPTDEQKAAALAKAKAVKERLDKGEDFAKVAKEVSDDKRTSARGGDAGQVAKDDMRYARANLKEIPEAAFKLKKDQVSDPIETSTGYYILKVTADPSVTNFEDAKRVLGFEMQANLKNKLLEGLKKDAKIEYAAGESKAPAEAQAPASMPQGHPTAPAQPQGGVAPQGHPPVQAPAPQGAPADQQH